MEGIIGVNERLQEFWFETVKNTFFLSEKCGSTKFSFLLLRSRQDDCSLQIWAPHEEAPCGIHSVIHCILLVEGFQWKSSTLASLKGISTRTIVPPAQTVSELIRGLIRELIRVDQMDYRFFIARWSVFPTKNSPYQLPKINESCFYCFKHFFFTILSELLE